MNVQKNGALSSKRPECGSQVFYTEPTEPDLVVVAVGSFADPSFPAPTESGYDSRRHPWIGLPESMRLLAPELWWDHGQPLYKAGKYAEAAEFGRLVGSPVQRAGGRRCARACGSVA